MTIKVLNVSGEPVSRVTQRAAGLPAAMVLTTGLLVAAVLAVILLSSSCEGGGRLGAGSVASPSSGSSSGPSSGPTDHGPSGGPGGPGPGDLPTLGPSGPPKSPTDPYPLNTVAGIVTVASSGPCYRVESDDGKLYALYRAGGPAVAAGATIRASVEPLELSIYCGPGQPMRATSFTVLSS